MKKVYHITSRNFPQNLVAKVSEVHAIALLFLDQHQSQEQPDSSVTSVDSTRPSDDGKTSAKKRNSGA